MNRRLLFLLLLLLLPFVLITWWVQPSLDDLSIPVLLRAGEGTRLELFRQLMHHWNGRYTSNLLAVLSPLTWGSITGYRLLLVLQFPALCFALYYLLSRLLSPANPQPDTNPSPAPSTPLKPPKSSFSRPRLLASSLPRFLLPTSYFLLLSRPRILASSHLRLHLLSAALLLLYLHGLPGITESIYWLSGAITYTWALIVQLLILGLMADTLEKPSTPRTLLLAALLFLASGFNEIALAINGLLAVGYWLLAVGYWPLAIGWTKDNFKKPHAPSSLPHASSRVLASSLPRFLPLLAVLLAAAIVLFSPGNAGRMWHFPEGGHLASTFRIAAWSTAKLLGVMAQNIPLLLTGFLLFPLLKAEALRPALRPLVRLHPLAVAALALLFLLACMAIPAWAMGLNPPLRIYNYLMLFTLGFFFWFLFSLREKARKQESKRAREQGSKRAREQESKIAREQGSKRAREQGSKIAREQDFSLFSSLPRSLALFLAPSLSSSLSRFFPISLIFLILLAMALDFHKQPTPFGEKVHPGTLYTYRGNLPRVTSDLIFRVRPYQQSLKQREIFINQQKALGKDSITLAPLVNPPTSIFFLDVTTDPNHWINQLQAEWHGVEKIKRSEKAR